MDKKTLVFQMTVEVAQEFWERVRDLKAETEEERRSILIDLMKEGKMLGVSETSRTKEQYVKDLSREFKVLDLSPKEDSHD